MYRLLSGTALAATLALAASAWAQSPLSPHPLAGPHVPESAPSPPSTISGQSTPPYAAQTPGASAGATTERRRHVSRRVHRARHVGRVRSRAPDDNIANQLNAQELAHSGGGLPPGMMGSRNPYGQRSPTQGIPGAGQVPQSPNYPSGPGPAYAPGQYQVSPSPNYPGR